MSATRQKIIQTSYELFGRGGFHAVGLDQIIDEVGISKQTFYNHFPSKDDLIIAVLEHRHATEQKVFGELLQKHGGDSAREKLYKLFDALHEWYSKPEWTGCIFMTAAAEFPTKNEPAHQLAAKHLLSFQEHVQYLATLAGAKDPEGLACKLVMIVEGAISYRQALHDPESIIIAKGLSHPLLDAELGAEPKPKKKPAVMAKAL